MSPQQIKLKFLQAWILAMFRKATGKRMLCFFFLNLCHSRSQDDLRQGQKWKKKKEDSVFPPGCHLIPPIQVTGYRCQRIKHLMLETWWLSSFQGESSPLASKSPKSALLGENRSEGQSWNCDLKPPRSSKADLPGWSCFYSRECHGRGMCTWQTVGGILYFMFYLVLAAVGLCCCRVGFL